MKTAFEAFKPVDEPTEEKETSPSLAKDEVNETSAEVKERHSIYSPVKGRLSFLERKIAKL